MATFTAITSTPAVNASEFKYLAKELLAEMVSDDTSSFKDMKLNLEDYLDAANDLDATQKAGIFADFLKDSYNTINSQAMQNAFNVLKANADYELARYDTEAKYNAATWARDKTAADTKLVDKQILAQDKSIAIQVADLALKEGQLAELRAKLKKQYGVSETVEQVLGDGTGSYKQFIDGIWYKVNADGDFVDSADAVIVDPSVDGTAAVISTLSVTSTLADTAKSGAIDKQIRGYDMVNLKDVLKTLDERAALMQNAKVPETVGDKELRKEILEAILDTTITLHGVPAAGETFSEGSIDSVTDIVVPD